jgi:hypothetical protein
LTGNKAHANIDLMTGNQFSMQPHAPVGANEQTPAEPLEIDFSGLQEQGFIEITPVDDATGHEVTSFDPPQTESQRYKGHITLADMNYYQDKAA